jgi:hypothetical protein
VLQSAPRAAAVLIDDFTIGPIELRTTLAGSAVGQVQLGLDPAHVAGGARIWSFDVRAHFTADPPSTSGVTMGVAPAGAPPQYYYGADSAITAVNFTLFYDAAGAAGPGMNIDLQSARHNAIALDVLSADFDQQPAALDLFADSIDGQGRFAFVQLPDSAAPYRLIMPLFTSTQPALNSLKRFRLGTGNGNLFGQFKLAGISTASTADFNFDGSVDGADFLLWQRNVGGLHAGSPTERIAKGDANTNGVIDAADLGLWRSAALSAAQGASVNVPEPATLLLCLATALLAVGRRR